jgi:hypothetical protein
MPDQERIRSVTDYIVLRPADDAPEGFLPAHQNGRWLDTRNSSPESRIRSLGLLGSEALPTDRVEERPDGAVAQVWEVRPVSLDGA